MSNWLDLVSDAAHHATPVLKPITYAYKYRHEIQKYWTHMLVALNKGEPDVVVTGTAGAGKSVLMSTYHGEANQLDWREPGISVKTEVKPIGIGEWTKIVHVVPGQDTFEKTEALDRAFSRTKDLKGVIHVVDWGYTTLRDPAVRAAMVNSGIKTIDDLRAFSLKKELEEFKDVCSQIRRSVALKRGPKWLVIAVNKADLYLDRLDQAQAYYHLDLQSDFNKILTDLRLSLGKDNLKCVAIPVCSFPSKFEWAGTTARPQTDSVEQQRAFMRHFIDEVAKVAT